MPALAARAGFVITQGRSGLEGLARPRERQQHERVLQALALVHGDDAHQVVGALEAQFEQFGRHARRIGAQTHQPAQRRLRAALRLGAATQQFEQVAEVGQPPLAVGERAQPCAGAQCDEQRAKCRLRTVPQPGLARLGEAIDFSRPRRRVSQAGGHCIGGPARQSGRQRADQLAGVRGIGESRTPSKQIDALGRIEHAGPRDLGRADPLVSQPSLDRRGLMVGVDQHRDVARLHRTGSDPGTAGQQPGDFGRHGVEGEAARRRPREHPGHAVAQSHEGQGGQGVAGRGFEGLTRALPGASRGESDLGDQERIGRGEYGIHRPDQRGRRALVLGQRVALGDRAAGIEIGEDVRAAKSVDRLLGIADQHQRAARDSVAGRPAGHRVGQVDAPEDLPLQRIGVLALVDQRQRMAFAKAGGQTLAASRCAQRAMHDGQQIVEAQRAGLAAHRPAKVGRLGPDLDGQPAADAGRCVADRQQGLAQVGQAPRRLGAGADLGQPGTRKASQRVEHGLAIGRRLQRSFPMGEAVQRGQSAGAGVGAKLAFRDAAGALQPGQQAGRLVGIVEQSGELGAQRGEAARRLAPRHGAATQTDRGLGGDSRQRVGEHAVSDAAQPDHRHQIGFGLEQVLPPPPRRQPFVEDSGVGLRLQAPGLADRQRVFGDHPLAEPMDGAHRRLVNLGPRQP